MLSIPKEDKITHPHASLLGASLEAGLEMYKDLQNTYLGQQPSSSSPKVKRYTTMEKLRTSKGDMQRTGTQRSVGGLSQNQGQYEMEDETVASSGYQNV